MCVQIQKNASNVARQTTATISAGKVITLSHAPLYSDLL